MVWYGMIWYGMVWYGMVLVCLYNTHNTHNIHNSNTKASEVAHTNHTIHTTNHNDALPSPIRQLCIVLSLHTSKGVGWVWTVLVSSSLVGVTVALIVNTVC